MVTRTKLRQRPRWPVSGLNAATVADNTLGPLHLRLGLDQGLLGHRRRQGRPRGRRGRRADQVQQGRAVQGSQGQGPGAGRPRLGGQAAQAAQGRPQGRPSSTGPSPAPTMAVSGDRSILLDGVRTVINDRLLHPRTAVGIDTDGNRLLFLVIDGRSAYSRGYTMVELATMMPPSARRTPSTSTAAAPPPCTPARSPARWASSTSPPTATSARWPTAVGIFYDGVFPPITPPVVPAPTTRSRRRPRARTDADTDAAVDARPLQGPAEQLAPRAPASVRLRGRRRGRARPR